MAGDSDTALPPGFEGDRLTFESLVLAPVALLVLASVVFWAAGRRRVRPDD